MELTREQRAAAEACGCAFIPATEEQVRRLIMQRRVFRLDGEPVLATRDGAYFETHATLTALVERHVAASGKRGAAVDERRPTDGAPDSGADPAASGGPGPAQAHAPGIDAPTPAVDPSPTPEPRPLEPPAEAAEPGVARDGAAASAIDAGAEDAAPAEVAGGDGAVVAPPLRAARAPRQRRARQPKTPRWITAGKERRGRLK